MTAPQDRQSQERNYEEDFAALAAVERRNAKRRNAIGEANPNSISLHAFLVGANEDDIRKAEATARTGAEQARADGAPMKSSPLI
jgi:hypothetical protein